MTGFQLKKWLNGNLLYIFVPVSIWMFLSHFNPVIIFIMAVLAIVPITNHIARSTHQLSLRTSTIVSSLLNASFGNAIEFLIAIFAIQAGLVEMVKASMIGSIILNILLLIGLSMLFGGLKYRDQTFNKDSAGVASTMLLIAVAGLSLPTIYAILTSHPVVLMSRAVSITLGITYLLSLVFVLFTHRHLFVANRDVTEKFTWSVRKSVLVLVAATGLAAVEANILVESLQPLINAVHLSENFAGLVVIAVITNIPEHLAAIKYARQDNITLSLEIGMSSAIQIALFVTPILVFVSPLLGVEMSLAFDPFQMVAMILTVMIINYIGADGICNWLEGIQLVAVYIIIAIAFFFI